MKVENGVLIKVDQSDIKFGTFNNWNGITAIGEKAFEGIDQLKHIDIPSSVTKIGKRAFFTCSNLTKVRIRDQVKTIEKEAFYCCRNLKTVKLGESIEEIPSNCFYSCLSLAKLKLPKKIKKIGNSAFKNCENLKKIDFNNGLEEIESEAFYCCVSLEKAEIPNSVKKINKGAFSTCKSLKKVIISESVKEIECNTFSNCRVLKEIKIPPFVEKIGSGSFRGCTKLEKIHFNDKVKEIGRMAFNHCTNLKSVIVPDSVENIGEEAFAHCYMLSKVKLPDNLTTIKMGTFGNCNHIEEINLPSKLENLEGYAFYCCNSLITVELNDNIKSIGESCFNSCYSLENINFPKNLEVLEANAFDCCRSLKSINIQGNIKEIPEKCFFLCKSLESVSLPESVEKIDKHAFSKCKLESIDLHKNIKHVGDSAFEENPLKTITFSNDLETIGENVFFNCDDLNEFIIDNKSHSFEEYSKILIDDENKKGDALLIYRSLEEASKLPSNIEFPGSFLKMLEKEELMKVLNNDNLKHFRKIYNSYIKNQVFTNENLHDFYKLAYVLGCFDNEEQIIDGKKVNIAQKSSVFLKQILDEKIIDINTVHDYFDNLNVRKYNVDLIKFLMNKEKINDEVDYHNFIYLYSKGKIISTIMNNFEDVEKEIITDEKGRIIDNPSIKRKIASYLLNKVFENVEDGNADLVEEFVKFSTIRQEHFDEAQSIRKAGKNVPHHIVGVALKEETIIESIERMKKEIEDKSLDSKKILDELADKEFTYEWLDKHDPKNFTLGLYCDCCASIVSTFYGKEIMKASILREDVQNMVIRNSNGDIIAKATIYVNKEKGYAVFNDIEMNRLYGNENEGNNRSDARKREKIYKAFKKGVDSFVKKYNEENKEKPLIQVNVGWGYNRLKQTIKKFEKKSNEIFDVINSFLDAQKEQWIVYKKQVKNG